MTFWAVLRVSQPLPRSTTPPIFPLRMRVRNFALGGPTSVPITVSAVSEKPVAVRVDVAGLAVPETRATAATVTRPAIVLSMRPG